jgi:uncharacterized RDD family membrane protein YckC
MDNKINEGYSSEEAYSSYNEMDNKLLENLSKNNEYVDSYNKFYVTYNLVSILSMFVSLFIFHLLIPLFNKKHNTLGMKLFKTTLVTSKDSIIISNKQVLLRFFTLFITEYTLVYLLVNWMGLIFIVLASIFSISITKRKSSLHDLILKTEVKYLTSFSHCFITTDKFYTNKLVGIEALNTLPLIICSQTSEEIKLLKSAISEIKINPVIESWTTETLVKLVKNGNGIGYVQEAYVKDELEKGTLKKLNISFSPPKLDIYCGYISDTLAYAPKKFIDFVIARN